MAELVAIPSLSGDEEAAAILVESRARELGLNVVRDETSVRVSVGDENAGPTLAFATHLDVVPPGDGWRRDPFIPVIEGDLMYGRGTGDAKASVASMLYALADLQAEPLCGRALGLFTFGEETRHASMPLALPRVGRLDAAVVGEPTNLQFAVAQRGLMMVDLVSQGDQRHAGYADDSGTFVNAINALATELVKLDGIVAERQHPLLGVTTVTPTMLEAGVSRNVTPPSARAVLDIRSTPAWTHDELEQALNERLDCRVEVTSKRLVPCETPSNSSLLEAALAAAPETTSYGSPTCSDWCYLRHLDAVKVGPGTSRRSHTPDESVDLPEVVAARKMYARIAKEYLS